MASYSAFISYSHAADGKLAPALQFALHRFARPWYKLRALRVFRDATNLSVSPGLWSSIERALGETETFLLLASPQAAASKWVRQEVDFWLEHRSPQKLLIILTDGELTWDALAGDFDWQRTDAVPDNLRKAFGEEPLYIDLRWAKTSIDLSLNNPVFRNVIADLAATLHGRPKDELIGEDVRQHRKIKVLTWSAVSGLVALTLASLFASYLAIRQGNISVSRELAVSSISLADVEPELGLILASHGARVTATPQVEGALRQVLLASRVRTRLEARESSIYDIAFSPDGRYVVAPLGNASARIVESALGRTLTELTSPQGQVMRVAFSPDGKRVLTVSDDRICRIWDVSEGRSELKLERAVPPDEGIGTVQYAAFSSDGRRIWVAINKTMAGWDASTGESLGQLATDQIVHVGMVADGAQIVLGRSGGGEVVFWEPLRRRQRAENIKGWLLAVSPDGRLLVTDEDDTPWLRDSSSGRAVRALRGHTAGGLHAAFSPDGRFLVTASRDATAIVWEVATGKNVSELHGHSALIWDASFSADGRLVATASGDRTARVWEAATGRLLITLRGHTNQVLHARFSGDGQWLGTIGDDHTARVWNVGAAAGMIEMPGAGMVTEGAALSPDGRMVVVASQHVASLGDARTGIALADLQGHRDKVVSASFSPDGRSIVTASADATARVWDVATRKSVAELRGHKGPLTSAGFSPDGKRVVTTGHDDTARVWSLADDNRVVELREHSQSVRRAMFSPDGQRIVTASWDGTAIVWDAATGASLSHLRGHAEHVNDAVFSPDGRLVLTASTDRTARIWDATTGKSLSELRGHTGELASAAFSPDGRMVVTASWDNFARLWQVQDGKELRVLRGHTGGVTSARFSPDSRLVITGSEDNTARVWEVASGNQLAELPGGEMLRETMARVVAVAFSADGRAVLTASSVARLYPLEMFAPLNDLLELAASHTTRKLTSEERAKYLHQGPSILDWLGTRD